MLTQNNNEKLSITLLIVGTELITLVLEEDAHSPRLLFLQKDNQKAFCSVDDIQMGRKTFFFVWLSSTYYAFGCKKYIFKDAT